MGGPGKISPRWQKGESGNPNGRPRKFVSSLKHEGYKLSEINETIMKIIAMTKKEAEKVLRQNNATLLELIVAGAMLKALKNKDIGALETIISKIGIRIQQDGGQKISGKIIVTYDNDNTLEEDARMPEASSF